MSNKPLYAEPLTITDRDDCLFYHTLDIPGVGVIPGEWDLRDDVDNYLGGVEFRGKRVLELGSASGFLCAEMEKRGADVVAYDLSPDFLIDIVPYARVDLQEHSVSGKEGARRLNNAFWFTHRALNLNAKMAHGTVYDIPSAIGPVDIVTFGSILEHVRDPVLALKQGCRMSRERVVVTNVVSRRFMPMYWLGRIGIACKAFLPDHRHGTGMVSWWILTPEFVRRSIGMLGFEEATIRYHSAIYKGRKARLYTVVGKRTAGTPVADPDDRQ
ncbi:MAG: methyltransferase domain-containing protein [Phycisphaerae bacterium]|jgi:SAM-dependent methyltransferase